MRRFSLLACLMIFVGTAGNALGHGFRIDIDGNNKLVLHSDDPTVGMGSIYRVPSLLGPANSRSNDHPGYDVDSFNGPSGFSGGESISLCPSRNAYVSVISEIFREDCRRRVNLFHLQNVEYSTLLAWTRGHLRGRTDAKGVFSAAAVGLSGDR